VLLAHGIGGVRDLPVPDWLFFYGAGAVLVVSFAALAALWREPLLERGRRGRPLPAALQRLWGSPFLRVALSASSLALLVLVFLASLLGERSAQENLAPTFVWVVFWLGLVPLAVLLGDVWSVLNPWRAGADAVTWAWRALGRQYQPPFSYPERLGRYPATVLLLSFATLELAYSQPSDPRALALAIFLYSAITWAGMALFGRRAWLDNGEAFTSYFGILALLSPLAANEGRLVVRWPLVGLATPARRPGTTAFLAVMLGSVLFDGFSRTTFWQDRFYRVQVELIERPSLAELAGILLNLLGLLLAVAVVGLAFVAAVRAASLLGGGEGMLEGAFVHSLVPIALVYAIAHYFSLFVLQGQAAIRLASDPFGRGWDLFGSASFTPDLGLLTPNTIWYVQVGALVAGHVAGLAVAHDRAVSLFRSPRLAAASQYPMLVLMVAYTVAGLWVLSQG